jgi:hypothetical protein
MLGEFAVTTNARKLRRMRVRLRKEKATRQILKNKKI